MESGKWKVENGKANHLSPLREKTSPAGVTHFVRTPAPSPDGEGRGEVLIWSKGLRGKYKAPSPV